MLKQVLELMEPAARLNSAQMIKLPHSEVCMHMRVAGKMMPVVELDFGMAQILNADGTLFSGPVTRGEAGISS